MISTLEELKKSNDDRLEKIRRLVCGRSFDVIPKYLVKKTGAEYGDKRGIEVKKALQAIVKELEEVSPKSKAWAKMYEISQREGENISDFATRIVEKSLVAYEDELMRQTAQLDVFVTGVMKDLSPS